MGDERRKGVAIVETKKGILLVAGRSKIFMLPGGGANRGESREKAAIRELFEETGLKTKSIKYLSSYVGPKWHTHSGRLVRNHCKIFSVKAEGIAKPHHEIKYIGFWKPGCKIKILERTRGIMEKYMKMKGGTTFDKE